VSLFWQSFAQALAALAPNATIASLLFSTMLSLTCASMRRRPDFLTRGVIFCGVVQPVRLMPSFWSSWITYIVPFRWILEMALGDVLGKIRLTCTADEVRLLRTGSLC